MTSEQAPTAGIEAWLRDLIARSKWQGSYPADVLGREAQQALAALEEQVRSARADAWQPIETAPKDGTTIFGQNWQMADRGLVHLNSDGRWQVVNGLTNFPDPGRYFSPTHWRPLPAPPQRPPSLNPPESSNAAS